MNNICKYLLIIFVLSLLNTGELFSQQWQYLGLDGEIIKALVFDPNNSKVMYAGGTFDLNTLGGIFKSTDGGYNWDTLTHHNRCENIVIHSDSSLVLYAATGYSDFGQPRVIKSTDGGITWFGAESGIYITQGIDVRAMEIDPNSPQTLYAGTYSIDSDKGIYKTTNAGNSWFKLTDTTQYSSGGVNAIAIAPDNSNIIYIGTVMNPSILKSTDGGNSWNFTGWSSFYWVDHIKLLNSHIVFASSDTILMKSTDGGKSWVDIGFSTKFCSPRGIVVIDSMNLFLGSCSGVWKTSDGGSSWNQFNNGLTATFVTALVRNGSKLYAATNHGVWSTDITTSVQDNIELNPSRFAINQNYPNPFNPQTTISYTLPKRGNVELKVYDVLGREAATLVNEFQEAGLKTVQFDAGRLSSGVYFYRITAGRFSEVKKMMVVK